MGLGGGSWVRSLWHDRLRGYGEVQNELALVLAEPYRSPRVGAAGELAWLAVVETPAAVADLDFPGAGPLLGDAGAHRDAQLDGLTGVWALPATTSVRALGGEVARMRLAIASSRWDQLQSAPMTPSNKIRSSGPAAARSASTTR